MHEHLIMTKERALAVYDILTMHAGAPERDRDGFVHVHSKTGCAEWRFQGSLGFGGKYRAATNSIDCYSEDETSKRKALIENVNIKLISCARY